MRKFLDLPPDFERVKPNRILGGAIAQLVEQRTENPCVAGSNPAGTTSKALKT